MLQLALSIPELGVALALGLAVFWAVTAAGCRLAFPICDSTGGVVLVALGLGLGIVCGSGYWISALVLGVRGRRRIRYTVDAVVAAAALGYIGALMWQAESAVRSARAASEAARRDAATARANWIAALRQSSSSHGPPGVVPPMLSVNDAAQEVEVTNTSSEGLVVALARVRPGLQEGEWQACPLLTVGEITAYYRFSIGPGHTTRYAPVRECAARFDGAPLEFRVGDPRSKVGWWSDSAFASPDDRVR